MKIRKLADAAIVAAMLMTSIPDLSIDLTPDDLLVCSAQPAAIQADTAAEEIDNPASRKLS